LAAENRFFPDHLRLLHNGSPEKVTWWNWCQIWVADW